MPLITAAAVTAGGSLLGGLMSQNSAEAGSTGRTSVLPFSGTSGLGTTGMGAGGAFTQSLDPRFRQFQDQALNAGQGAFGQLNAFNTTPFEQPQFDLNNITQEQFNLLESLQQNQRQQATLGQEERLFSQGRLGSTGGIQEQRSLQDQIGQQQSQNMANAFGQGLSAQGQQFNQALGQSQQQLQQQLGLGQLGQGLFNTALAPEQALQNQIATFGSLAPSQTTQKQNKSGGILGAIGGLFSDERLKKNIKKIGQTDKGFNLYSWEWNDLAKSLNISGRTYGVIAQEVQAVSPEAVMLDKNGYLKVNYDEVI